MAVGTECGQAAAASESRVDCLVPLRPGDHTLGVLSLRDRRDCGGYGPDDLERAALFAELAVAARDVHEPSASRRIGLA